MFQALAIYERIYGFDARIAFQADLITQRIADENAGGANYKIGQELAAILPNLQELSNHNIVTATWQSAKKKIAVAADADAELKSVVSNIKLTFDRPLQELPTQKSMLAKGLRTIGFSSVPVK